MVSRFKSLNGKSHSSTSSSGLAGATDSGGLITSEAENGKTIEEMLAELGPEESWVVPKDEESQINELLKTAQSSLKQAENVNHDSETRTAQHDESADDQKEIDSIGNDVREARTQMSNMPEPIEDELDDEADQYLAKVLDQIKHEPEVAIDAETTNAESSSGSGRGSNTQTSASIGLNLPSAPAKEPDLPPSYSEVAVDDELASRFANLGVPSVPTSMKTSAERPTAKQQPKGYTDEEIDSWCTICNEDATLSCIGCDGDLYCTNCWLEGHKGPDAGYEEKRHKAVQYNKGGGMKKQPARRMMGA